MSYYGTGRHQETGSSAHVAPLTPHHARDVKDNELPVTMLLESSENLKFFFFFFGGGGGDVTDVNIIFIWGNQGASDRASADTCLCHSNAIYTVVK